MREKYEFRVPEKHAGRLFSEDEGTRMGETVRKVFLFGDDPRLRQIGRLDREIRELADEPPRYFFAGWNIERCYTKAELSTARLFTLFVKTTFEPAGEECGTEYNELTACPKCGAGAAQVSDLRLDLRKVPKTREIATTIAGEIVVSQRLAEKMIDAGLTGFELRPVRHKARYEDDPIDLHLLPTGREIIRRAEAAGDLHPTGRFWVWLNRAENRLLREQARQESAAMKAEGNRRSGEAMPVWHQLVVTSVTAEITPPTRVGINPFDDDPKGECRCPLGDLIGLNLLSEVSICAASRGHDDVVCSRQFIGVRRGLLRPCRVIVISPKFWTLIESENLKGVDIEVAHLV